MYQQTKYLSFVSEFAIDDCIASRGKSFSFAFFFFHSQWRTMFSCHSVLLYSLNDYKYLMFRIRFSQSFENSRKKSIVLGNKVYQPKKKKGLWVISLIILFLIKNLHKFYNIVVTKSLCEVCGFFLVVKYVLKILKNFFRGIAK